MARSFKSATLGRQMKAVAGTSKDQRHNLAGKINVQRLQCAANNSIIATQKISGQQITVTIDCGCISHTTNCSGIISHQDALQAFFDSHPE